MPVQFDSPAGSAKGVVFDAPESGVVFDGPSPYSPEAIAAQRQALTESIARRRQLREEADARAALPRVGIGLRAPFGGPEIGRMELPEELVAFGAEAVKSSPSTAAGVAAASASMPLASRVGMIPGPVGAVGRFAVPVVTGGVAALGTRLAQDELLPQILPEQMEESYRVASEVASRNPNSAMLGQFAGALPFFRPGLPMNTEGGARLAVPAISGGISGGIEGASQIAEGDLDVQRLAMATAGGALLNRETALGARLGPNLVLPNRATQIAPAELDVVGRTLREPVLPDATAVPADELQATRAAMGDAQAGQEAEMSEASRLRIQRLGQRMMGIDDPAQRLQILDQEIKLAGDTLTVAEQRAGLDMKILLKQQVEQQKALEQAAKAQADAAKEQQQAMEQAQKGLQEAMTPPEAPKSQQILEEAAKPAPLANVATEVATQTKQSPFALQSALNEMTATPATAMPQVATGGEATPLAGQISPEVASPRASVSPAGETPSLAGPRDATVSDGSGVPTAKERKMLAEQQRLVDEYLAAPKPAEGVALPKGSVLTNAIRNDNIIMLSFDITGDVPKQKDLKKIINDLGYEAEVVQFSPNIFSTANGEVKFRVDVFSRKDGSMSKSAEDLYQKVFGTNERISGKTAAQISVPMEERVAGTVKAYRRRETGERYPEPAPEPSELPAPPTAELRLNNADLELPPLSAMSRAEKRAELDAAGITTYNGKPLDAANPAEISAAVGKLRRGQLERGAISPKLLTPAATSAAGGVIGFTSTDQQPGETDEEFQARRLRNAALGVAAGAGTGIGLNSLAIGAQARRAKRAKVSGEVDLPETGPGQGVRQTAEKIIENRSYTEKLRQTLADDPDIIYDKFALGELADRVEAATVPELQGMLASANIRERLGATAELANRYSLDPDPAVQAEGARLYSELAQNLTNPAQLLGLGKLVKTPQGFVTAINAALKNVKRTLSVDQEKALNKLAADNIKAERELAAAERAAEADFTEANEAAYKAAQAKVGATKKALDDFVHQVSPESWGEITSKIIQGNLMAPLSFVKNIYGNLIYQPALRGVDSVASALDTIHATASGRERKIDLLNPLPRARELEAAADGIILAGKELITGPSADSYVKAEVQRGFKPLRSLVSAFTGENLAVRPDGSVSMNDRAKKFVEGTLGVAPEISFRLLNLGDKGFRRASEMRILLEQGRLRGLTGRDLDRFIEFPDKATQELVNTEGRSAIFAQENALSSKLTPLLDKGIAEFLGLQNIPAAVEANKVLGRLIVPFRNFPINFVSTAVNFAVPEVAVARAVFEARKGNRREAYRHIGEAAIGMTMLAGGKYLWDKGVISEPADKDAKQRSVQYEQMGPQRLNVSGLQRLLEGGDPTYQLGDDTRDWGSLGIPAAAFYVFTSRAAKGKNAASAVGEKPQGKYAFDRLSAIPGMASFAFDQSFLSGTSAFLEALKDWDEYGDKFTQNMFRAVTSVAVPNSLEAYAKTQFQYIPELKGDNLTETLENVWKYKTLQLPQDSRSNVKRDLWGEPVLRTPEGKNPYLHQFVDVTKAERKIPDPFKQGLIDLYKVTGTPDVYPTLPSRMFEIAGTKVNLTPDDYNMLQQLVGRARREIAEAVVSDSFFTDPETVPEAKIIALQKAYSAGAKQGKAMLIEQPGFVERYPELFGERVEGEGSRVQARDAAARARLRLAIEEDEAVPAGR